ncbi:hypothetical protein AARAC_003825 [Aspergillus arachidicola]|uniref:Uncharacterized protein n=1 Tax=Aspergillus arachidicola TaxID=656916 RepID=A0A2G7G9A4_9EURO|nr:hypothetical protein AARAC_003825 [Aspergillus arachidicola]
MPIVFMDLPTQIPNNPDPGDPNYMLVTDRRLPKCSGNYARSSSSDTLCVNREKSTARALPLARHTESLILWLCRNIEPQFAPALFDAIEEIITYYDENADNNDIWNQLLRDLNTKNDGYGEYLRRQMSDWKQESCSDPQLLGKCQRENSKRWEERKTYTQQLRDKLVNDGKLTSNRDSGSLPEGHA